MKTKQITFIVLSFLFTINGYCLDLDSTSNTNLSKNKIELPKYFYKKLKGTIGGNIPITMVLTKYESSFNGTYYYDNVKIPIKIGGRFNSEDEIYLDERNFDNISTGEFTGSFTSYNTFEGVWRSELGKTLKFKLTESVSSISNVSFKNYYYEISKNNNLKYLTYCDITLIKISTENPNIDKRINRSIEDISVDFGHSSINEWMESVHAEQQTIKSRIVTEENNILSIEFHLWEYNGGNHGNSIIFNKNFDLITGNEITTDEIFKTDYQKQLEKVALDILHKDVRHFYEDYFFLKSYAITPKGLLYRYGTGTISAYASGELTLFIPYKNIRSLLKEDGILSNLLH